MTEAMTKFLAEAIVLAPGWAAVMLPLAFYLAAGGHTTATRWIYLAAASCYGYIIFFKLPSLFGGSSSRGATAVFLAPFTIRLCAKVLILVANMISPKSPDRVPGHETTLSARRKTEPMPTFNIDNWMSPRDKQERNAAVVWFNLCMVAVNLTGTVLSAVILLFICPKIAFSAQGLVSVFFSLVFVAFSPLYLLYPEVWPDFLSEMRSVQNIPAPSKFSKTMWMGLGFLGHFLSSVCWITFFFSAIYEAPNCIAG